MKKYFLFAALAIVFLAGTATPSLAQTKLPENVRLAVETLYPDGEQIEWDNEDGDDEGVVYLINNDSSVEITFDKEGSWGLITTYIGTDDLPAEAQSYLSENYPKNDFSVVLEVKSPTKTSYLVNFETETNLISLSFDESGKLIEKQVEDIDG